jgi:hypothetical protein
VLDPLEPPSSFGLPAGITGIPRARRWDATAFATVPELRGDPRAELEFEAFADGTLVSAEPVEPGALATLAAALAGGIEPPYAARAVRRSEKDWAVGALAVDAETVALPPGIDADSLEVVLAPDGELTASVDGEPSFDPAAGLEDALAEIERRGRERFESFVARADRVGDRWTVTVEPL